MTDEASCFAGSKEWLVYVTVFPNRSPGALTPASYYQDMSLELTFDDLIKLAATGKLEKDGTALVINRPVLTELNIDPKGKSGKVIFFLDETDPRTTS